MRVLSPAGTTLMQQNGRFLWEFWMHQRDALEHWPGCCTYPAEHLCLSCVCPTLFMTIHILHSVGNLFFSHAHMHIYPALPNMSLYVTYTCKLILKHKLGCRIPSNTIYTYGGTSQFSLCFARTMQQTVHECTKPGRCPAE